MFHLILCKSSYNCKEYLFTDEYTVGGTADGYCMVSGWSFLPAGGGEVRGWPCAPSPEGEIMLSAANDALWRIAVDAC